MNEVLKSMAGIASEIASIRFSGKTQSNEEVGDLFEEAKDVDGRVEWELQRDV